MTEEHKRSVKANLAFIMNLIDLMFVLGLLYAWEGEHAIFSIILVGAAVILKSVFRFTMATL